MRQRLHGKRLFEDAGASLIVDQGVVHRLAASDVGDAAPDLNRLRYLKVAHPLSY